MTPLPARRPARQSSSPHGSRMRRLQNTQPAPQVASAGTGPDPALRRARRSESHDGIDQPVGGHALRSGNASRAGNHCVPEASPCSGTRPDANMATACAAGPVAVCNNKCGPGSLTVWQCHNPAESCEYAAEASRRSLTATSCSTETAIAPSLPEASTPPSFRSPRPQHGRVHAAQRLTQLRS